MEPRDDGGAGAASAKISILPYSRVVGQDDLKLALELAWISPRIGGVLVSGQRGTAKSTTVRAFAMLVDGDLPVTLPINATDDRVVGGWDINQFMKVEAEAWRDGLLLEANDRMLYIDEVNLLDDHLVNLILDVASTGILTVERDNQSQRVEVRFALVGTMNPSEGWLRPQLLDRFGLLAPVVDEPDRAQRVGVLTTVLAYDAARSDPGSEWLAEARRDDEAILHRLRAAQERLPRTSVAEVADLVAAVADALHVAGHRGDIVLALAAQAIAARDGRATVEPSDVARAAKLALAHRLSTTTEGSLDRWREDEQGATVAKLTGTGG